MPEIEPSTSYMQSMRSTIELHPVCSLVYVGLESKMTLHVCVLTATKIILPVCVGQQTVSFFFTVVGRGGGMKTGDLHTLWQRGGYLEKHQNRRGGALDN